jgi:hypothetical protein
MAYANQKELTSGLVLGLQIWRVRVQFPISSNKGCSITVSIEISKVLGGGSIPFTPVEVRK